MLASSTNGQTLYTATGLTKGLIYQFKVLAHNGIGYGAESLSLSAVAADTPNQPNAPLNVELVTNREQIGIEWTAPLENVGASITSYIIKWKTQAEGDYMNSFETADALTFDYTITELSEGVYYDVVVQAKNVVGNGLSSHATRIVAAVAP